MKYWQFLAITWEPDLTRFSPSIQFLHNSMNHKNFHFTQIPDKTDDMIFLKSPKILFLGHFWLFLSFLPDDDFFQKIWLLHCWIGVTLTVMVLGAIYEPLTPCYKFQKKPITQFWENLWTDGRMDGQALFYRTYPAETAGPKILLFSS